MAKYRDFQNGEVLKRILNGNSWLLRKGKAGFLRVKKDNDKQVWGLTALPDHGDHYLATPDEKAWFEHCESLQNFVSLKDFRALQSFPSKVGEWLCTCTVERPEGLIYTAGKKYLCERDGFLTDELGRKDTLMIKGVTDYSSYFTKVDNATSKEEYDYPCWLYNINSGCYLYFTKPDWYNKRVSQKGELLYNESLGVPAGNNIDCRPLDSVQEQFLKEKGFIEVPIRLPKVGEWWECKKNCAMLGSGIVYMAGKIYPCTKDNCLTDEEGDELHRWHGNSFVEYFGTEPHREFEKVKYDILGIDTQIGMFEYYGKDSSLPELFKTNKSSTFDTEIEKVKDLTDIKLFKPSKIRYS
jgi:hypothetical protein